MDSIDIKHIPASTLNEKFGLNLSTSESLDDDDPRDTYYYENSNDQYYDMENMENLLCQFDQSTDLFTI